ncbi:MAG: CHRD domain-containing protein [Chitinophagaceae bacterium]
MKTRSNYLKSLFVPLVAGVLMSSMLLMACSKDDNDNDNPNTMYNISGNASASQEVPANASTGTATLTGTYNAGNNSLNYTINWTGLTDVATVAHFHGPAAVGVSANPLVDIAITSNGINGTASGTITLADSVETALLAGNIYYNVHTLLNPNGEIRGQVAATLQ